MWESLFYAVNKTQYTQGSDMQKWRWTFVMSAVINVTRKLSRVRRSVKHVHTGWSGKSSLKRWHLSKAPSLILVGVFFAELFNIFIILKLRGSQSCQKIVRYTRRNFVLSQETKSDDLDICIDEIHRMFLLTSLIQKIWFEWRSGRY